MQSNSDSKFKGSFFYELFLGLALPLRALKLIMLDPKLLSLSVMPVLITLAAMAGLIYFSLAGASTFIYTYLGPYFGGAAQGVLLIALLFLAFQSMILIVSLFAIPFNDWLAEQTEKSSGVALTHGSGVSYYSRVMFLDILKTILNLVLTILFTLGTWIPLVGIIFFLGLALLNTLNFIAYPQSRRLEGVSASLTWLKQNGPRSFGFGIATLILFSIPVINFFALPISVVGGTLLYLKR